MCIPLFHFIVSWSLEMLFGMIYLETWGYTKPYVAFLTLEFRSWLFFLDGTHMAPNSLTFYKPVSVVSCVKSVKLARGWSCLPFLVVKMLGWEGSLLVWGGCVCLKPLGSPVNLWTTGTVCIVSPLCEVCASNLICHFQCHCPFEQKFLSLPMNACQESISNTSFMMSQSVMFSPYNCTAKCILAQFGTQQTQHLQTLWFKHQHCLACCMLLPWEGTDWSVQLKIDINMNLHFEKVMKESLQQNEGHLPVVILH
jgi:hypothetical protein